MRRRSPGDAAFGRSKLRARGGGASIAAAADPRPILAPVPLASRAGSFARFDAKEAMDQIFQLGCLIAKARQASDAHEWRAHVRALQADLRAWADWDDGRAAREFAAATTIACGWRRLRLHQRYNLAVRERAIQRQLRSTSGLQFAAAWDDDVIPTGESTPYQRAAQAREAIARRRAAVRLQKHYRGTVGRRAAAARRYDAQRRGTFGSGLLRALSFGRAGRKRSESPRRAAAKTPQRGRVFRLQGRRSCNCQELLRRSLGGRQIGALRTPGPVHQ